MILIAHQQGHTVDPAGTVPEFYVSTTHTRMGYDHRRRRRPMRLIVLGALLWMR